MKIKMIKKILIASLVGNFLFWGSTLKVMAAESNLQPLNEVITQVLRNYPSIKIARLEIDRARQEFAKIESQLGWILRAQTGVSHDVGAFNIPSDRFNASASIGSVEKSGNRLEVSGQYTYEDSDTVAIPSIANPSESTTLDLNYRIPFGQGENNPNYSQGLISAQAGLNSTKASRIKEIDGIVQQTMQLYFDAANTYMRIKDANKSINRAKRLLDYVKKNRRLGLAERKDVLNIQGLLTGKIADRDNLLVIWSRQRSELNRLLGNANDSDFAPVIEVDYPKLEPDVIISEVYTMHPDLMLQQSQLKSAESRIELATDTGKDKFDVVLSVGARNTSGDTATGSVDNSEWAGGARIEYQFSTDQRGFDAELFQAMLDKQVIEEQINKIKRDLKYNVNSILEQIDRNRVSAKSSKRRLAIEREKVDEILKQYRRGRATTSELIDNENTYFTSSLLYETRKIELARKYAELDLLLGSLWDRQALLDPDSIR
jgi:outer membrane protein TolC